MDSITEKAYAKINLYLDVEKKRDDGFHDILTIMQLVTLYDEVTITLNQTKEISVQVVNMDIGVPENKNIAYIAAQKFYENLNFEAIGRADIKIKKNIPIAAGLAGGSADAAAVLRGLNDLYGKPYTTKELCKIGLSIGSDVPFCIVGGVQVCRGKGDVIIDLYGIKCYDIVIACGEEKDSTAEQYKRLDEKFNNFKKYQFAKGFSETYGGFLSGRCRDAFKSMFNIFETLYEDDERMKNIKEVMYKNEAKIAMLSGSGPSIYGVFPSRFGAEEAQKDLERQNIKAYFCRPINKLYEEILPGEEPWR